MTDRKQTQLPLPTRPTEPDFVGESMNSGEYVTVLTPDNKAMKPDSPTAGFDPNGLRMYQWTINLHDADRKTAYYWWVFCCPCVSLAQLETRLGLNSCGTGVLLDMVLYLARMVLLLTTVVNAICGYFGHFIVAFILFLLCMIGVAHRVSRARMLTRERLEISGSAKDDRITSCFCGSSAIRQMAVQLKCDQVHFGSPATLQSYQV